MAADVVVVLLDTDVMIEVQRRSQAALDWIASESTVDAAIPSIVAMELMAGSRDRGEMDRAARSISAFRVLPWEPGDDVLATDLVRRYCLGSGLGVAACLIAAQAINRRHTLYTFNARHFSCIPGLASRAPYQR